MEFPQDLKKKVIYHLGYSARFINKDSLYYSVAYDRKFEGHEQEDIDLIQKLVDRIDDIDLRLEKSIARRAVDSIGKTTINKREMSQLREEKYDIIMITPQMF